MKILTASKTVLNPPLQTFSVGDRASILNDAFSLADATQLSYDIAFDLMKYLAKEEDYVPWTVAVSKLTSLKNSLMFTETYINYKQYASDLIEPIYKKVGWTVGTDHLEKWVSFILQIGLLNFCTTNSHLNSRLRQAVLSAACSLGVESCLEEAAVSFKAWLEAPTTRPHPDVRETVYYYGMQTIGDEETWDAMWQLYIAESDANEKSKLMYGLSAVQVPWILNE